MHTEGEEVHVDEVEATAATKDGTSRNVLFWGLLLAGGILAIMWATGVMTQSEAEEDISVNSDGSRIETNQSSVGEAPALLDNEEVAPE
ncbi:hypothetical protein [Altererythrobacter sp. MF3-039]|uniref:hypothetical protein n=1 Tax=Altererythrobacter sp. MF3-039 TaxID=3252901 RepID=UPI00390C669C